MTSYIFVLSIFSFVMISSFGVLFFADCSCALIKMHILIYDSQTLPPHALMTHMLAAASPAAYAGGGSHTKLGMMKCSDFLWNSNKHSRAYTVTVFRFSSYIVK